MRIEERADGAKIVVTEREDCHWCKNRSVGPGFEPKAVWVECPKCKGTGKRGNGRCRECNARDGYFGIHGRNPGHVIKYDDTQPVPCSRCEGNWQNHDEENWTDNIDISFLPVEVLRSGRPQSWREAHLGLGVYTVVDYGRHKTQTDEELIEKIMPDLRRVQACKVVNNKEEMRLADGIVIVTADQGFSAVPYFGEIPEEVKETLRNA